MPRLMSFAKTVPQILNGTKDVTRRLGWEFLKPGDVIEGVEWSAGLGKQWTCNCGRAYLVTGAPCPRCGEREVERRPRRLGLKRVVAVSRERLGDISPEEIAREGFPGLTMESFLFLFGPDGKPDTVVTRIEFEPMEDGL